MSRHSTTVRNALASRGVKPVNKLARRAARWVVKHAGQTARIRAQLPGIEEENARRQAELDQRATVSGLCPKDRAQPPPEFLSPDEVIELYPPSP